MEQFLNIPNPIGFLWLILVGLSMMIAFLVLKFTKLEWDDVLVGWMVSITIIITISLWGAHKIERVNVSDYQWKQIYTNNMNAKIDLKPVGFLTNRSGKEIIEVGKPLGKNAHLFVSNNMSNQPDHTYYDIVAKTDNEIATKRVELSKVISDGEITGNSKIVKIEYRPYNGYYHKWGSHIGSRIDALENSAEIQITIQNETGEKLNDLFNPEK